MAWTKTVNIKGPTAPATNDITGRIMLVNGQDYIDVTFPKTQLTLNWHLIDATVFNTVDISPLTDLCVGTIVSRSVMGFRARLSRAPDSDNYYLLWTIRPPDTSKGQTTVYLMSGPRSGSIGKPAGFMVEIPDGTTIGPNPLVVTPHDSGGGGTFNPATVELTDDQPFASFDYIPASYGNKSIASADNLGLTDPFSQAFLATAATYTLDGPTSGNAGEVSTPFTVALPPGAPMANAAIITPRSDKGGVFTPASVKLDGTTSSATFTYTPAAAGAIAISTTNDIGLTDPAEFAFTGIMTPMAISGLYTWWKVDAITGLSDGAQCNGWTDSSGSGFNLGYNGPPGGPTYKTNIINGLPVLRFDGTAAFQLVYATGITKAVVTIFIVAKQTSKAAISQLVSSAGTGPCGFYFSTDGSFVMQGWNAISDATDHSGAFHIFSCVFNANASNLWVDGAQMLNNAGLGGQALQYILLGASGGGAPTFDVAELIYYDGVVSDADRQALEQSLSDKYALPLLTPKTPDQAPGLFAWYKPESLPALNDGDQVQLWPDSSGHGLDLAPRDAVNRVPTYASAVLNGYPGVRFISGANPPPYPPWLEKDITSYGYPNGMSWFIVARQRAKNTGSSGYVIKPGSFGFVLGDTNGVFTLISYVSWASDPANTDYSGAFHIFYGQQPYGGLNTGYVDGKAVATNTSSPYPSYGALIILCNDGQGSASFDGDIVEAVFYNPNISDKDLTEVWLGLKEKYGL